MTRLRNLIKITQARASMTSLFDLNSTFFFPKSYSYKMKIFHHFRMARKI